MDTACSGMCAPTMSPACDQIAGHIGHGLGSALPIQQTAFHKEGTGLNNKVNLCTLTVANSSHGCY
jgi:hypothetical protein